MSYNTSFAVVKRMEGLLDQLLQAKGDVVIPTKDPDSLAYRFRESMFAAQKHSSFARFHDLRWQWRTHVLPGRVRLEFLGTNAAPVTTTRTTNERLAEEVLAVEPATASRPTTMTVPEVTSLAGIVGAALEFKSQTEELFFPEVYLNPADRYKLFNWCQTSGWKYIDHEGEGVTLTRAELDPALLWRPE